MTPEKDIRSMNECPDCASMNIVHGMREQIICRDCGLIFEPFAPTIAAKPMPKKKGKAKKAKPKRAKKKSKPAKKKRKR